MNDTVDPRQRAIERERDHHFQTYGRQPLVLDRGDRKSVV